MKLDASDAEEAIALLYFLDLMTCEVRRPKDLPQVAGRVIVRVPGGAGGHQDYAGRDVVDAIRKAKAATLFTGNAPKSRRRFYPR